MSTIQGPDVMVIKFHSHVENKETKTHTQVMADYEREAHGCASVRIPTHVSSEHVVVALRLIAKQLPRLIKEFQELRSKRVEAIENVADYMVQSLNKVPELSERDRREAIDEFMNKTNSGVAGVKFDDDIPF